MKTETRSIQIKSRDWGELVRRGRLAGIVSENSAYGTARFIVYLLRLSTSRLNTVISDETRDAINDLALSQFGGNADEAIFFACKLAQAEMEKQNT